MDSELAIEYLPLDEVLAWPGNPKAHATTGITESIRRWGFVTPLVRDDATGRLVEGHGRVEALNALKRAGEPPPARVRDDGGRWLVPVVVGASFANEAEAAAFLIAANRLGQAGGWDDALLGQMLREVREAEALAVTSMGFEEAEVRRLLETEAEALARTRTRAPQPQRETVAGAEVVVEIMCSRAALEAIRATLDEWGARDDVSVSYT